MTEHDPLLSAIARAVELRLSGQIREAAAQLTEVADQALAAANTSTWAEALIERSYALMRLRTPAAMAEAAAEMRQVQGRAEDVRLRGLAHLQLAALAIHGGDFPGALGDLRAASSLLEVFPVERARALDAQGAYWAAVGHVPRARACFQRAIDEKRRLDDIAGLALSFGQLGRLQLSARELDAAAESFRLDLDLCADLEDQRGASQCRNHLAQIATLRGDGDAALELLDAAAAEGVQSPFSRGYLLKDRALALASLGRFEEAAAAIADARAIFEAGQPPYPLALLDLAEAKVARGTGRDAETAALRGLRRLEGLGAALEQVPFLVEVAEVLETAGKHESAAEYVHQALVLAESCRADRWVEGLEDRLARLDENRWLRHAMQKVHGMRERSMAMSARSCFVVTLFSDIAGFTAWSADLPADEVVRSLNDYFEHMSSAVSDHKGYLDKYIGDGIMVLFGGEDPPEVRVRRACACALDMIARLEVLNEHRRHTGRPPFRVRIGLNAGMAVEGNIGSYEKLSWTAIGREVNLAARLEGLGEPGRVRCGAEVARLGRPAFRFAPGGVVSPKGLPPTETWWLDGATDDAAHANFDPVPPHT